MNFLYYKIIIIDEFVQFPIAQIADATFKQKIPSLLSSPSFKVLIFK